MIWKEKPTLEQLNQSGKETMLEHIDIKFTEIGDEYLKATMPVDHRTIQPAGLLHGGALVTLAETIGSVGANLVTGSKTLCVGLDINSNHIRSTKEGIVTGVGRPWHLGKSTQVWHIEIYSGQKLINISRLTLAVIIE